MTSSEKKQSTYHKAVLVEEVIAYLAPKPYKTYVDVTFGGGTHTRRLLEADATCKVIAFDWDNKAIELNAPALQEEFGSRFQIIWGNFANLTALLKKEGISSVDGILADFGTSQFQIHKKAGFSFATDTPLDMRMSPAHQHVTARAIINYASEKELITIFKDYGEEHCARPIARAIVEQRTRKPFKTTGDLIAVIETVKPKSYKTPIHPATKAFQALRMVVNKELENIHSFLLQAINLLSPEGRLVCISFHSLEDRMVKHFFKDNNKQLTLLTQKVVTGTAAEITANASARSAKLRAVEAKSGVIF
jgi:16S rRNA (cytosine1402-N4)-methyltransferase